MTTLTVGNGQQYATLTAAVAAANSGDTIDLKPGTYTNDFPALVNGLTIEGVGGIATLVATAQPSNGKAYLDVTGNTTLRNLDISGVTVTGANGAAVRYESGSLVIQNSFLHGNQNGLLSAASANGTIIIDRSEVYGNGTGSGSTHNLYIGNIAQFTLTKSYIHDANTGHEVKSRAANNTIMGDVIADNTSTSSYEIDLPSGGNSVITNNVIEQGPNSQNPNIIAIGEEGTSNTTSTISVSGNTIVNDLGRGSALWNATGTTADFSNNSVYGFGGNALVNGMANQSGNTVLGSRPSFTEAVPAGSSTPVAAPPVTPAPTSTDGLVVNTSEDAYWGDAQLVATVDGQQVGGVQTVTALHGAGQSQAINLGTVAPGQHQFGISFLNDAYAGTPDTDRNLYVNSASYNGQQLPGISAGLFSVGTDNFGFTNQTTTSNAVINVSEDAYQGDAQFTISVDGQQQGSVYTAAASHAAGQNQAISLSNLFETFQPHDIAVTFLNDKWDGTPDTDRNLYVNSIQFDGQTVPGAAAGLYSAGTNHFTAIAPANWTG